MAGVNENWASPLQLCELSPGFLGHLHEFQLAHKSRGSSVEFYTGT